jgi:hypothetical protein
VPTFASRYAENEENEDFEGRRKALKCNEMLDFQRLTKTASPTFTR